jgi:two-component system, sensor histidine kinase and response regulator
VVVRVLFLDDELNNLVAFKASFRHDFKVFTANNVVEALQVLSNNEVHVIISDQRMPDMTGVEFFEHILHKYPEPVRILLTAYSDLSDVIKAINKGQIFRYIEKPWDHNKIVEAVESSYKHYWIGKQLKMKNQELEKMNQELSRFVYSASHDLKAPVKTLLGLLSLTASEEDRKEAMFHLFSKSIKQLDNVINGITDFYKNHSFNINLSKVDFQLLFDESIVSVQNSLHTSFDDVIFRSEIHEEVPFVSDNFRIALIINNLMSNAIKYQKASSTNKWVKFQVVSDKKQVKITIEDNGLGIPEQYQHKVYNMFYRANTESSGSGIGLYIVKETVNKLDGDIMLISSEGLGTKFEVTIPNMG